jgi:hypothetical protein
VREWRRTKQAGPDFRKRMFYRFDHRYNWSATGDSDFYGAGAANLHSRGRKHTAAGHFKVHLLMHGVKTVR